MTDLALSVTTPAGLAAETPADAVVEAAEAIVVRLGVDRFAADLASVAEVGRVPDITRIPGVPSWLAGVANWRGRILPILDLRRLLGAQAAQPSRSSRLLVLTERGIVVGMLVDAVEDTITLGADVTAVPAGLPDAAVAMLRGQLVRDNGPVAVIDVDAVMRLREQLPRGRRSV